MGDDQESRTPDEPVMFAREQETMLITLSSHTHGQTGSGPTLAGDLLVVLSLMIALGWILLNQHLLKTHPPIVITAYGVLSGALMLLVWVWITDGPPPVHNISMRVWMARAAFPCNC